MKILRSLKYVLLSLTTVALITLIYSFYTVPDEIRTVPNEEIEMGSIYSLSLAQQDVSEKELRSISSEGNYEVNVSLFNAIPVKSMNMTVSKRQYVVVSGEIFGLRLFTKGVVIVSTSTVDTKDGTKNPASQAGLQAGDVIISVNSQAVTSCKQVSEIFAKYDGNPFEIVFARNGKEYTTKFDLCFSKTENKYVGGLWIRDSAAGIGTMTFYDKNTGIYAGLGHGVCDVDTNSILPLYDGDIVKASINGCYKGKSGEAGELCGTFSGGTLGSLCVNCNKGVYGYLSDIASSAKETPVALSDEVQTGSAEIIATVDSSGPEHYSIEIEKVNSSDSSYRNLVIKITDERLIDKTGGIVQGMSGSPIIQNGMLVGAVTHVFINDPLHGYGILAENMIATSQSLAEEQLEKAS